MSPCVKKCVKVRRELALVRAFTHFLTYGECRDSEQSPCDCEPVGMDSLYLLFLCLHGECRDNVYSVPGKIRVLRLPGCPDKVIGRKQDLTADFTAADIDFILPPGM